MLEKVDKLAKTIEGSKDKREITIFTLSTCMWCKKCKRWLAEHDVKYRYIDLDKLDFKDKAEILDFLRANYSQRISYPFMIYDNEYVIGYDPNKYEELINGEGS